MTSRRRLYLRLLLIAMVGVPWIMISSTEAGEGSVWIEAEAFETLGGWVIDQQSIDQMGSAYVMAHGMGAPVSDATTTHAIPQDGTWTVWVRTRDWTAPWKRGTPGGRFQLLIDGKPLPEALGANGAAWDWQKAGTVQLKKGEVSLTLRDLTGFNGRCDAIYLTLASEDCPPSGKEDLAAFRRQVTGTVLKDDPVVYDLAIAGGGVPGVCTALAAIRTGSKVVLIQDRPVLGGNNSSEIRVPMGGDIHVGPYPRLGNVVQEISPIWGRPGGRPGQDVLPAEFWEDARKANVFCSCPANQYRLALSTRVIGVERDKDDPRKIAAYLARNLLTGEETRFRARLFVDATGDAVIARMMGAEVMYGRESRETFGESLAPAAGDREVMGMSVLWVSKPADKPTSFPDIDWGIEINEDNVLYEGAGRLLSGDWEWETGQHRDQALDTEYIRDYGMMAIFANWSFLKNRSKRKEEWARDTLHWISFLGGKRESYRVVGDHILTQNDIEQCVEYPDGTACVTWNLDLHFPDPEHLKKFDEPFRSCAYHRLIPKPYPAPYRCLYSKDVPNLFLAGRHISASHVAFGAVRVMRTLGMLGEVVGMAASICAKEDALPRDVYEQHLDELKAMMSAGIPSFRNYHGGGTGKNEGYHFKEIGHLRYYPKPSPKLSDPKVRQRIEALGVQHMEDHDKRMGQ